MIRYLEGKVCDIDDGVVTLLVGGVGYEIVTLAQAACTVDEERHFYIHTNVREDAITLYGFATRDERRLFGKLLSVSGIGAKLALSILDTFDPMRLRDVILGKRLAELKQVPGVGNKVASRLMLELESVMQKLALDPSLPTGSTPTPAATSEQDLRSALKGLGYTESAISPAIAALNAELSDGNSTLNELNQQIRWVLAWLRQSQDPFKAF